MLFVMFVGVLVAGGLGLFLLGRGLSKKRKADLLKRETQMRQAHERREHYLETTDEKYLLMDILDSQKKILEHHLGANGVPKPIPKADSVLDR